MQNLFDPNRSYEDIRNLLGLKNDIETQQMETPSQENIVQEVYNPFTEINPEIENQNRTLEDQIELNRKQRETALKNVEAYGQKLLFDPGKKTEEDYKNLYQWKGASKKRKALSILTGVFDALGMIDKGPSGGIRGQMAAKNQREFENIQATYPQLLQNERLVAQNANQGITNLIQEQQKNLREREKNRTLIEAKQLMGTLKTQEAQMKYKTEIAKLNATGELNSAKAQEALAKARSYDNPRNIFDFANRVSTGNIKPNAVNIVKDLFLANRAAPSNQLVKENEKVNLYLDENDNVAIKPSKSILVWDPRRNELLPSPFESDTKGGFYSVTEGKALQDLSGAKNTLTSAAASIVDDILKNTADQNAGLNNTKIKMALDQLFETDPQAAIARSTGNVASSFGTLMHLKGLYGGRPPESLMEDIKMIVEGKAASPIQKVSALYSQAMLIDLYLHEKANDIRAKAVYNDPGFYNHIKNQFSVYLKKAQAMGVRSIGKLPTIGQLLKSYVQSPKDSGKTAAELTEADAKINPIAAGALTERKKKLEELKNRVFNAK